MGRERCSKVTDERVGGLCERSVDHRVTPSSGVTLLSTTTTPAGPPDSTCFWEWLCLFASH